MRKLTQSELDDMETERTRVGAIGRNAFVCACGHIDYRPNGRGVLGGPMSCVNVSNCIIYVHGCIECMDLDNATQEA